MQDLSDNFSILLVEDNSADQFLLEQMLLSSRLRIKKIYTASTINRVSLFNAKVNIQSMPGEGCSLEVELNSK